MATGRPSAERVREVLAYDRATGVFIWRVALSRKGPAGSRAGHAGPKGRWVINLDGDVHYAARLAWLYVTGEWPRGVIAQKNGISPEVPFDDLADQTQSEIRQRDGLNTLNKSGIKGVSWSKTAGKWVATITRDGRQHHLGKFQTKEEAGQAYRDAAESGSLPGDGSARDPDWANSRRKRSAKWADIQFNPAIVGWVTIEDFLRDVGAPPTAEHVLMRERYGEAMGPGNVMWRLPWAKRQGHEEDPQRSYNVGLSHPTSEPDHWPELFLKQNGCCAICGQPETGEYKGTTKRLAIDHSHSTGVNRGLLCARCNMALGAFKDNSDWLRKAALYVEEWEGIHADSANVIPLKGGAA